MSSNEYFVRSVTSLAPYRKKRWLVFTDPLCVRRDPKTGIWQHNGGVNTRSIHLVSWTADEHVMGYKFNGVVYVRAEGYHSEYQERLERVMKNPENSEVVVWVDPSDKKGREWCNERGYYWALTTTLVTHMNGKPNQFGRKIGHPGVPEEAPTEPQPEQLSLDKCP